MLLLSGLSKGDSGKILLRYHPRPGTTTRFWSVSHYLLEGKLQSGPRPERGLRVDATDSIELVSGDSVVRAIALDSMDRTNADYSTGEIRSVRAFRVETIWTNRRVQLGPVRGIAPAVVPHSVYPNLIDGTASLPDQPVGLGDSWKGEGTFQLLEVGDSLGALRARITAKLKSVTVEGGDTIVILGLKLKVAGPEVFYRDMSPPQSQQISGTLEGEERFSVTRGVSDSLNLGGTLFTEFDLGGAGRSSVPTHVSLIRASVPAR